MTDAGPIIVEPAPEDGGRWRPVVGPETMAFLQNSVPEASRDNVSDAAVTFIGKGVPPT